MINDMGINEASEGVITPGVTTIEGWGEEHEKSKEEKSARGNYLGNNRIVIHFAMREISRLMSKPEE